MSVLAYLCTIFFTNFFIVCCVCRILYIKWTFFCYSDYIVAFSAIRPVNVSRSNSSPWIEYPYYTTTGAAYYHSQETTKIGDPFAKTSRSESNNFTSPPKENLSSNAKSEITWNNLPRIHTHMTDKMHRLPIRDSTINSKSSYQLPDVQREQDGRNNILKFVSVQLKPRHHWFSQLLNYFSSVQRSTIDSNTFQRHKQALPWNTETRNVRISPQAATSEDLTTTPVPVTTTSKESQDGEGCPWNLSWCAHVPVLHLAQYAVGTLLYGIGYPLCHVLTFAIFSKVLGSKPQVSSFTLLLHVLHNRSTCKMILRRQGKLN